MITKEKAKKNLENLLVYFKDKDLKVGKIIEKANCIEGEIVTKDNISVKRLMFDKNTGFISPLS